jgi:sugar-specific transcriptional regulator TrmB
LSNGLSTPPNVSRGTKIARPHCYGILEELKSKGLVEEQAQGERKAYVANDPEALVRALEQKREQMIRLLPDLRALYNLQRNKPRITFFDGLNQVQEIFLASLSAPEIFSIGSTTAFEASAPAFFENYQRELWERSIIFHDVLTDSSIASAEKIKEILRELYDATLLPKKYNDIPTNILIWENNIALIDFSQPIFGTVLSNVSLAKTFQILFGVIKDTLHSI